MAIEQSDIEEAGTNPKRVTGDEGTVEERTIDELIKADRYGQAKNVTKPPFGLRVARIKPHGTV